MARFGGACRPRRTTQVWGSVSLGWVSEVRHEELFEGESRVRCVSRQRDLRV